MIIDAISDLHGNFPQLDGGDLLIVAGDLTRRDDDQGYTEFERWFKQQKYTKKILIAGNHDNQLQEGSFPLFIDGYSEYLCDSGTEFEGLRIWGSPWTKRFPGMNPKCMAFTVDTDEELAEKWAMIPEDTEILITHCPPLCILDQTWNNENVGSVSLLKRATSLPNLRLFIWGHIHEQGGKMYTPAQLMEFEKTVGMIAKCKAFPYLANASHVNEHYEPVNKPIRIEL